MYVKCKSIFNRQNRFFDIDEEEGAEKSIINAGLLFELLLFAHLMPCHAFTPLAVSSDLIAFEPIKSILSIKYFRLRFPCRLHYAWAGRRRA